jgi:outer membrane protein TolC
MDSLPPESIPRDLEQLYLQAVAARPELHARLAQLRRDRTRVELARLAYLPDVTMTFDWGEMTAAGAVAPTADGIDNLGVGFGFNAPIYRNRIDAAIREAQAQMVATARRYDSLRDETLEQVADLFSGAQSQQEMLALYLSDILPRSRQALQISIQAYQVGGVDFLQMLDNWRTVLRHEVAARRLESQLRQTLAELERVVGGPLGMTQFAAPPEELPLEMASPLLR